jgi:hypothetical protein
MERLVANPQEFAGLQMLTWNAMDLVPEVQHPAKAHLKVIVAKA